MVSSPPRPDLAAHEAAMRLDAPVLVKELRARLGARFVAYLAGVRETRAVNQWADGEREIRSQDTVNRLRFTYQVLLLLTARDDDAVASAWFMGLNPELDDRSPARLLREGDLAEVGPQVLAAARSFAAHG